LFIISRLAVSSFPAKAIVGVKNGDWAKYSVNMTWQSTISDTPEPDLNIEWIKFEVQNVVGNDVTANLTWHYNNGTETSSIQSGNILAQTGELSMMFIQADMKQGDNIGVWYPDISPTTFTLNETVSRNYIGVTREVNHLDVFFSTYDYDAHVVGYWDKATGVVCEFAIAMHYEYAEDSIDLSTSLTLTETNIWGPSQIWAQWWFFVAIVVIVVVIVVSFVFIGKHRRRPIVETETPETNQIVQESQTSPLVQTWSKKENSHLLSSSISIKQDEVNT